MTLETLSENRSFGGTQGVYRHRSQSTGTDMTFAVFMPELVANERVPVLWYLSGLTCTHENAMTKAAAHVAATKWALHLKDEGFVVITLSPGMVDTTETNVSGESRIPCASPDESAMRTWKKYCTSGRPAPGICADPV